MPRKHLEAAKKFKLGLECIKMPHCGGDRCKNGVLKQGCFFWDEQLHWVDEDELLVLACWFNKLCVQILEVPFHRQGMM